MDYGNQYARNLVLPSDLTFCSLEQAIFDLKKITDDMTNLNVVCNVDYSDDVFEVVKTIEAQFKLIINIVYSSYLNIDAWFITNGDYLIFSPGA